MIVEIKGIRFDKSYTKPIEIHLEEMHITKTPQTTCFTATTEEGQVLVLYLPEGKPCKEIKWGPAQ